MTNNTAGAAGMPVSRRSALAACLGLALAGLPCTTAWAQTAAAAGVMPDTFANVVLGMTQAELLRARPAILPDGFKGDNAGHAKLLFEKTRSPFVEQVIYLFDERQPTLASVVFSKQQAASAFRSAVTRKWGLPDQIGAGRTDGNAREIVLVWRRNDAVISASYPADSAAATGTTTVRIGRPGSVTDTYVGKLEAVDKADQQKLLQQIREQLGKAPAGAAFQ